MSPAPDRPPAMFNGLKIIESRYLTEAGEPYEVRRSWQERLFSHPWHPWHATKIITPQVPMKGGYRLAGGVVVMHPDTLRTFLAQLEKDRT